MDLSFNEEQILLRDSVRRWVRQAYPFETRNAIQAKDAGFNRGVWQQMADAGWLAVGIPEAHDGLGAGPVEIAVICEELGRGLVLEPYIASAVFATQLIIAAASEAQQSAWLPAMASGTLIATVAYSEPQARGAPDSVGVTANRSGDAYVLSGRKSLAVGAPLADMILVSARSPEGVHLFALDASAAGVRLQEGQLVDGRRSADLVLDQVHAPADAQLGEPAGAPTALELALHHAIVAQCAESVGVMEQAMQLAADYLKTRKQFGVPIGTFQVLQHRMADMAIDLEMARSMLFHALRAAGLADPSERRRGIAASKSFINQKAKWVTGQAIQLHGGIGMTEEFVVGHYFKRMVVAEFLYGSADWHLNLCADALQAEVRSLA